jgi:hypothetical protein
MEHRTEEPRFVGENLDGRFEERPKGATRQSIHSIIANCI